MTSLRPVHDERTAPTELLEFYFSTTSGADAKALRKDWLRVWLAASNAGGAIDFVGKADESDVAPRVDAELARAVTGQSVVGTLRTKRGEIVAFAVLVHGPSPLQQHWRLVARVMVHPDFQGIGVGSRLMREVHEFSRGLGLEQLRLTMRSGQGLENFYQKLGYQIIGRHPDGVKLGPGEYLDEITMAIRLHSRIM